MRLLLFWRRGMEKGTVKRISRGVFEYGGRQRQVGDRFEVELAHVPVMLAMGHIEAVEGEHGYVKPAKKRPAEEAAA